MLLKRSAPAAAQTISRRTILPWNGSSHQTGPGQRVGGSHKTASSHQMSTAVCPEARCGCPLACGQGRTDRCPCEKPNVSSPASSTTYGFPPFIR